MGRVLDDPIHDGVPHDNIAVRHVDLRAQHGGALLQLAILHLPQHLQALLHWAVAVGTILPRRRQCAAQLRDLLCTELIDVCPAALREGHCPIIKLLEVVRGVARLTVPLEAEPLDIFLDAVNVLLLLTSRVGIIEPQVARTIELVGNAKVQTDGLRMAYVKETIRLRWEACAHAAAMRALVEVLCHDLFHEVPALRHIICVVAVASTRCGCKHHLSRQVPLRLATRRVLRLGQAPRTHSQRRQGAAHGLLQRAASSTPARLSRRRRCCPQRQTSLVLPQRSSCTSTLGLRAPRSTVQRRGCTCSQPCGCHTNQRLSTSRRQRSRDPRHRRRHAAYLSSATRYIYASLGAVSLHSAPP
mmetsp:Transcript_33096/g.77453  ORF Transcript_33096/g.77453 Transcript_33096/m.77453 type:complete len:358 (+) Transcript_33096:1292-2365(+)